MIRGGLISSPLLVVSKFKFSKMFKCKHEGCKAALRKNIESRSVTKEQAIEIYNTYPSCTINNKRKYYADKYNTNISTIGDIVTGRTYNDWTGAPNHLKKRNKKKK